MSPLTYKVFNLYSFIRCGTYNCFLRKRTGCLGRTLRRTGLWYHWLGHWGKPEGPSTSRLEQPHKQERHHTLIQNLKAMSLWVLLLIRCSTSTLLSNVRYITTFLVTRIVEDDVTVGNFYAPSEISRKAHGVLESYRSPWLIRRL